MKRFHAERAPEAAGASGYVGIGTYNDCVLANAPKSGMDSSRMQAA